MKLDDELCFAFANWRADDGLGYGISPAKLAIEKAWAKKIEIADLLKDISPHEGRCGIRPLPLNQSGGSGRIPTLEETQIGEVDHV